MRKLFLSILLALLSSTAHGQISEGAITMQRAHHNWLSSILMDDQSIVFRTNTFSKENLAMLALDYSPPQCTISLWLVLDLGITSGSDNFRSDVLLSFRADSGKRFDLPATSSVTMGDKMGAVTLSATDQFTSLMSELRRGRSLRIKILFGDNEAGAIYLTYSLLGFTAAQARAFDLCTKPATRRGQTPRSGYIDRL